MSDIKYLLEFWFSNPDIWFGCGPKTDQMISNKFGHLLSPEISEIQGDGLEHIILWDQVTRHVYRGDSDKIKPYHQKSLELSLSLLKQNYDLDLKPEERWFLLMPLRHTFNRSHLETVIEKVRGYMETDGFETHRRFYRATLLSYSKIITQDLKPESVNPDISDSDIFKILDNNSCKITKPVVPTLKVPNPNDTTLKISNLQIYKTKIYKEFHSLFHSFIRTHHEGITVSISGGVDSMVCSYVLYHLRTKCPDLKIVAVMVNYNNRQECLVETQLVARWLKFLDIPLYVRHVKYLRRKNLDDLTDRDFYEKITKQFRFDLYRRFGYPVILGHNKDDCIENIFTNIRKGRNYDNLNGMKAVTLVDGVTFYRPVLSIPKADIYSFAKNYGVPYLIDSTPSWSDRGKIRDTLVPFLNDFDPALIPGLINLSSNISGLYQSQNILVERFVENIRITPTEAILTMNNDTPERRLGFGFWKQVIQYITDALHVSRCTNRSIYAFIKHIGTRRVGKTNLSKHLEVIHNYDIIIFTTKRE